MMSDLKNAQSSNAVTATKEPVSVLFVCLGNICRSPMGHAVLQDLSTRLPSSAPPIEVDSAGTGAYHTLSPPDPRTMTTLRLHGINNFDHAARQVHASDFSNFDYILAMDSDNLEDLLDSQKRAKRKGDVPGKGRKDAKVLLFGEYGGRGKEEVDDPYYGRGGEGFEIAFEQCQRFSRGWLKKELGVGVE